MQDIQTVLVILLGIGFIVLLIGGIAVIFIFFKILSNIRRVTQRLDETTEDLGHMAKYLGTKVGPAAASALASVLLRRVKSSWRRRK
jgi:hypothetical protein